MAREIPQIIGKILQAPTPALRSFRPDAPAELEALVNAALAKDRTLRIPDVAAFGRALLLFAPEVGRFFRRSNRRRARAIVLEPIVPDEPSLARIIESRCRHAVGSQHAVGIQHAVGNRERLRPGPEVGAARGRSLPLSALLAVLVVIAIALASAILLLRSNSATVASAPSAGSGSPALAAPPAPGPRVSLVASAPPPESLSSTQVAPALPPTRPSSTAFTRPVVPSRPAPVGAPLLKKPKVQEDPFGGVR